jgi:hypothetical protein
MRAEAHHRYHWCLHQVWSVWIALRTDTRSTMSFHLTPAWTMSLSKPVTIIIPLILRYTVGHTPLYRSHLLRGLEHIRCASSGYYNRLSTISSRHGKSQTCLLGKVMCDQPANQHPQLPRRESLPRAIYLLRYCNYPHSRSILIRGWKFSRFFNGTFGNMPTCEVEHCSLCLRGDTADTLPILKLQTHQCLHWLSSEFPLLGIHPLYQKRAHQRRSQRRLLCCYSDAPVYYRQWYSARRKLPPFISFVTR